MMLQLVLIGFKINFPLVLMKLSWPRLILKCGFGTNYAEIKHFHSGNDMFTVDIVWEYCVKEHQAMSFSGVGANCWTVHAEHTLYTTMKWWKPICYMFHWIGLNMMLITYFYGHLPSQLSTRLHHRLNYYQNAHEDFQNLCLRMSYFCVWPQASRCSENFQLELTCLVGSVSWLLQWALIFGDQYQEFYKSLC